MGQRSDARRLIREGHALVSPRDFEKAALNLPGLEVGRAKMMAPSDVDLATGTMRLVAMRTRPEKREDVPIPESARWLESVRQRLASRVALGSRLRVTAPKYVRFTISATIEAEPRKEPGEVCGNVKEELRKRLALVADGSGAKPRPFGLRVDRRDLAAWIQKLPGVRMVRELSIQIEGRGAVDSVEVAKDGLPSIDLPNSSFTVVRSGEGTGS
jgi:predicted phage baseplate assembly protein